MIFRIVLQFVLGERKVFSSNGPYISVLTCLHIFDDSFLVRMIFHPPNYLHLKPFSIPIRLLSSEIEGLRLNRQHTAPESPLKRLTTLLDR